MCGVLYGVGIGPGDPELLTLKAVRMIRDCDVIGIPAKSPEESTAWKIACKAVPEISEKEVIAVPVPMTKDKEKLEKAYDAGCLALASALRAGKNIAFLNLGDPTLYGTYMVIHKKIRDMGLTASLVSGVSSICAVAAALNLPLGERKEAIHILPASYPIDMIQELKGTKVLMKSAGELKAVKQKLLTLEKNGLCKAFAVSNCGMENQKIFEQIECIEEDAGYFTTILVKDQKREI